MPESRVWYGVVADRDSCLLADRASAFTLAFAAELLSLARLDAGDTTAASSSSPSFVRNRAVVGDAGVDMMESAPMGAETGSNEMLARRGDNVALNRRGGSSTGGFGLYRIDAVAADDAVDGLLALRSMSRPCVSKSYEYMSHFCI